MSTRGALAVIAGILLALGVVLAFVPVSIDDDVTCGSAVTGADDSPTSEAALADYSSALGDAYRGGSYENKGAHVAQCEDRVGTQRLIAFPLVGVGTLALIFVGLTSARSRTVDQPPSEVLKD